MARRLFGIGISLISAFFTFCAIVLLVFVHVGQVRPDSLPRMVSLINVNTAGVTGAPAGSYGQGLYSYCTYTGPGVCSTLRFAGGRFRPLTRILADAPEASRAALQTTFGNTTFGDTGYLDLLSQAAFWTIFIGSCAAVIAFVIGLIPTRFSYALAAAFAGLSFAGLAIGAAIWTVIFVRIRDTGNGLSIGFGVANGLLWGAVAAMLIALLGYIISSILYKRKTRSEKDYDDDEEYPSTPEATYPVVTPVVPVAESAHSAYAPTASNRNTLGEESMMDQRSSAYGSNRGLVRETSGIDGRPMEMQPTGHAYGHDGKGAPITLSREI